MFGRFDHLALWLPSENGVLSSVRQIRLTFTILITEGTPFDLSPIGTGQFSDPFLQSPDTDTIETWERRTPPFPKPEGNADEPDADAFKAI